LETGPASYDSKHDARNKETDDGGVNEFADNDGM
jgi:hypothetical protein